MIKETKKKRKPRELVLRFRKNDPAHNLLAATQHWVMANGGSVIVIGGVDILPEGMNKYRVCIGVLGREPKKDKNANS